MQSHRPSRAADWGASAQSGGRRREAAGGERGRAGRQGAGRRGEPRGPGSASGRGEGAGAAAGDRDAPGRHRAFASRSVFLPRSGKLHKKPN